MTYFGLELLSSLFQFKPGTDSFVSIFMGNSPDAFIFCFWNPFEDQLQMVLDAFGPRVSLLETLA